MGLGKQQLKILQAAIKTWGSQNKSIKKKKRIERGVYQVKKIPRANTIGLTEEK